MNVHFVNTVLIGHILAIIAVLLNAFAANGLTVEEGNMNKDGVILAVLGIFVAYVQQTLEYNDAIRPAQSLSLSVAACILVAASYFSWLLSSF